MKQQAYSDSLPRYSNAFWNDIYCTPDEDTGNSTIHHLLRYHSINREVGHAVQRRRMSLPQHPFSRLLDFSDFTFKWHWKSSNKIMRLLAVWKLANPKWKRFRNPIQSRSKEASLSSKEGISIAAIKKGIIDAAFPLGPIVCCRWLNLELSGVISGTQEFIMSG